MKSPALLLIGGLLMIWAVWWYNRIDDEEREFQRATKAAEADLRSLGAEVPHIARTENDRMPPYVIGGIGAMFVVAGIAVSGTGNKKTERS